MHSSLRCMPVPFAQKKPPIEVGASDLKLSTFEYCPWLFGLSYKALVRGFVGKLGFGLREVNDTTIKADEHSRAS